MFGHPRWCHFFQYRIVLQYRGQEVAEERLREPVPLTAEELALDRPAPATPLVLAIDQGTTNTKAVLVSRFGEVVATGSAPVGVTSPRPGWVEQDAGRIWRSVLDATRAALAQAGGPTLAGVALSTQRESVVGWRASTGEPLGPVLGWQDSRTAAWCSAHVDDAARADVHARTGLRVDAMFSAPKLRWLLDHVAHGVPADDVRLGTVDAWLVWRLTGGAEHLAEAGNASRTLLYDVTELDWSAPLLETFGVRRSALPEVRASDGGFGRTSGLGLVPDGTPVAAVLADSHAALFGHGCTEPGMAKATYGTGSSVMTPVAALPEASSGVPTTLAWLLGATPTYALEGNILSSGATLAWTADLLTGGDVARLGELAASVADAGGVSVVPAFSGLGAPHWDRDATALVSGMTNGTTAGHVGRAAFESVAHQIADVVDVVEATTGPLRTFRADGGATASALLMQDQADLTGRTVEVTDVAEVSALGAAKLAWRVLGEGDAWQEPAVRERFAPRAGTADRAERRARWAGEVERSRFTPTAPTTTTRSPR
jgi:glycerol kinase